MKRLLVFATALTLSLVGSGLLRAETDPFVGTWKLNLAKSTYVSVQAPQSATIMTVEAQGDAMKVIFEGVAADGGPITYSFTIDWDGSKKSPIAGEGAPNGEDAIALNRVDSNTLTSSGTKAGKVVYTSKIVASKDGKVITITGEGTNEQGKPVSATTVWEKK